MIEGWSTTILHHPLCSYRQPPAPLPVRDRLDDSDFGLCTELCCVVVL